MTDLDLDKYTLGRLIAFGSGVVHNAEGELISDEDGKPVAPQSEKEI